MPLLDGYFDSRSELARELKRSEKTVARWENQPDGLPYTLLGGRKIYKKTSVLAWIESRECKPNPRRRPGQRREYATQPEVAA